MGKGLDILMGRTPADAVNRQLGKRAVGTLAGSSMGRGSTVTQGAFGQLQVLGARSWENNTTAARCIETTASNLASVDLVVMRDGEALDQHPIASLWNDSLPGAAVSARITRQVAFAMAEVRGEAFIFTDRGPTATGPVQQVAPIYDEVDVVIRDSPTSEHVQEVAGYIVRRAGKRIPLLPSEVLWLRYPHPTKAWHALAPWAAACGAAELDSYARAWQLGEFKNGAKPGMLVYLGDVDEPTFNRLAADFRTGVQGAHNAGKSMLVAGPTKAGVSRLSMTPEEMSYLATRKATDAEVMLAFGYRPDYFVGQSTYENQRAAKTAVWSDLYLAKLDVLGSEVDRQWLPDPLETAGFDVSKVDALQENTDAIYNRIRGIAYTDTVLLDEARGQLGLEPLPDGRGQVTLTEFRSRIRVEEALALQVGTMDPAAGRAMVPRPAMVRSLLPKPRRLVAHRGVAIAVRTRAQVVISEVVQRRTVEPKGLDRYLSTHERIAMREVSALADKQLRVVLRKLSSLRAAQVAEWTEHRAHVAMEVLGGDPCACTRIAADDLWDSTYWRKLTADAWEGWMRGAWMDAAQRVTDALGLDFASFDERVIPALDERRAVLADQVTESTRRAIDSTLLRITAEAGWSVDDAAEALRAVFTNLSTSRAETIARTEVLGGYSQVSYMAAQESGVVAGRRWHTAEDERVRSSHAAIHGEVVRGDERYSNGCRYPHDPNAPARETVNCRCVEIYELED